MKIGDYVRTKYGIAKIKEYEVKESDDNCYYLDNNILDDDEYLGHCLYDYKYYLNQIIKSSPNIIDLIEVGDYVNGHKITLIYNEKLFADEYLFDDVEGEFNRIYFNKEDIKSIITKECIENIEYKVGE